VETGWHGFTEYVVVVVAVSVAAHSIWRHYVAVSVATPAFCSVLNLLDEIRRGGGFDMSIIGLGPLALVAATVVALPISFVVGLPFVLVRRRRRHLAVKAASR
jgi:hypothetical protein